MTQNHSSPIIPAVKKRSFLKHNEHGETRLLLSSLFFIFIMFLCFVVTIDVWNLLQTKMRLNAAADKVARYIEHEGRVDTSSDSALVEMGVAMLNEVGVDRMEVTVTYPSGKNETDGKELIQLCDPFTVTLTGYARVNGFLYNDLFRYREDDDEEAYAGVKFSITEGGVSEQYWKDLVSVSDSATYTWTWTN